MSIGKEMANGGYLGVKAVRRICRPGEKGTVE
jgi:hypothetical protein